MMKQESAYAAGKNSKRINMQAKGSAPQSAAIQYIRIKTVRPAGKQPVYNMEVDKFHNFSVNGGIIVHNCMDDMRYFCATIMAREVRGKGV